MQDLRTEMVLTMESLGIKIEAHHHEVATAGQAEIDMRFTTLTRMADNLMLYKYVVKNVARKQGMTATFMPKPLFEDNASGMHVHQSLWKGQTNLFYGEGQYAALSELGRYYIGGLLKHAGHCVGFVRRPQTPTVAWCLAMRRQSIWSIPSATAPPAAASRCIRRIRARSGSSSEHPTRPATDTWRSPPC
jgi:Glutamine synthetase, catalytic domain